MLNAEQEKFLQTNPTSGPARVFISSPVVDGAYAKVEVTGGSYADALTAIAWVNTQGAYDQISSVVPGPPGYPTTYRWELASEDGSNAVLEVTLPYAQLFSQVAESIADPQMISRASLAVYEAVHGQMN